MERVTACPYCHGEPTPGHVPYFNRGVYMYCYQKKGSEGRKSSEKNA